MIPTCMVLADGKDITGLLMGFTNTGKKRLISLRVRDQRGYESDSLEIELNDTDAQVAKPRKGAELDVYLGYKDQALHYKGKYTVDEVSHSGPPDKLIITARAADLLASLKIQKTRSWHQKTLGDIVQTMAAAHGLKAGIAEGFASVAIAHVDQISESDLHFLTRLGKEHDAIVKPAAGTLLFLKKGSSTSVSGELLPVAEIPRSATSSHDYAEKGRTEHTGVRAYWHDTDKANRASEVVGSQTKLKTLSRTFPNAQEARHVAQAELDRLQRDGSTLSLDLRHGEPALTAEMRILPKGFRSYIDIVWVATEVEHELSGSSGLSTRIQCELPQS